MAYTLLDGKRIAAQIRLEVKQSVESLVQSRGLRPGLAFILVGDDPASKVYVRTKSKACEEVGFLSEELRLRAQSSEGELLERIRSLNDRQNIHGILVQHPLPSHMSEHRVYESIAPSKDVDGFHPCNMGKLLLGEPGFVPCTPLGIVELLVRYGIETAGRRVVIVGRSNIVGKPAAAWFIQKGANANATVTVCHSQTRNLEEHTRQADILIAAMGKSGSIKADMVREGVVVVDVGINRLDDPTSEKGYRIVGDVDFEGVSQKASAITPVPGGIGLMTVAMLLKNTLAAASMGLKSTFSRN